MFSNTKNILTVSIIKAHFFSKIYVGIMKGYEVFIFKSNNF